MTTRVFHRTRYDAAISRNAIAARVERGMLPFAASQIESLDQFPKVIQQTSGKPVLSLAGPGIADAWEKLPETQRGVALSCKDIHPSLNIAVFQYRFGLLLDIAIDHPRVKPIARNAVFAAANLLWKFNERHLKVALLTAKASCHPSKSDSLLLFLPLDVKKDEMLAAIDDLRATFVAPKVVDPNLERSAVSLTIG